MSTFVKSRVIGKVALFVAIVFVSAGSISQSNAFDYTIAPGNSETYTNAIPLAAGDNTITVGANGSGLFTGVISGTGNLVKRGDGLLALGAANTYTGSTKLLGGTIRLDHDLALNSWSNSASLRGQVTVTGSGTIATTADRTIRNRFVVADDASSILFSVASGTTLTIQNVVTNILATDRGGAIFTPRFSDSPTFEGGGNLVLQNNSSGHGGAMASYSQVVSTGFDLTELASLTVSSNRSRAGNGGGIYVYSSSAGNSSTLYLGDNVTFSGNSATTSGSSGNGGAVYILSADDNAVAQFGNNVTFSGNAANLYGGAIYAYVSSAGFHADVNLGTNTLFDGNTSNAAAVLPSGGGAVFSSHNLSIQGDTLFRNNYSKALGAAIAMNGISNGTLLLDTAVGDIGFTGNLSGVTDFTAPTGTKNSIHLLRNTEIRITGSNNVFFDDPISSGNFAGNSFTTDAFSGFVQFKGTSTLQNNFAATVSSGTLRLGGGTDVDSVQINAVAGTFTLGSGGTLAGTGTIGFGTNTISGTVAPDSLVYDMKTFDTSTNSFTGTSAVTGNDIGVLTFTGATKFDGANILVDIDAADDDVYDRIVVNNAVTFGTTNNNVISIADAAVGGTYNIITSTAAIDSNPAQYFSVSGNVAGSTSFGRYGVTVQKDTTNTIVQVAIGDAEGKTTLYWTGVTDDQWVSNTDTGPENWTDVPGGTPSETRFLDGDRVIFDTAHTVGPFAVDIPTPITVADMLVTGGGDYTITGNITATTAGATGKLVKEGTGTLTLNGSNDFTGGIDLTGGVLVAETVDSVKGGTTVTMANNSTLQFDNFTTGTFASDIIGTGNLLKSDIGTLTLDGNNTYTGPTNVRGGTLVGNIASGTDLTVSSGATYQNGTGATLLDRTVSSLNGTGTVDMQGQSLTVGVEDTATGSGDFSGGVLTGVDDFTKTGSGQFMIGTKNIVGGDGTIQIDGDFSLEQGSLEIDRTPDTDIDTTKVNVAGTATFAAGTTLHTGRELALTAQRIEIADGAILDVCTCSGNDITLIRSDNVIVGDFTYTIGGTAIVSGITLDVFVNDVEVYKTPDEMSIVIKAGELVWNNLDALQSHGTFNIGTTFTVGQDLEDRNAEAGFNPYTDPTTGEIWDGQTLTKTGDGTLILSGNNDYTGDTLVNKGTLIARSDTALGRGTGTANVESGASLVLDFDGTLKNALTGAGSLTIANSEGTAANAVTIDKANTGFTGATAVNSGATLNMNNVSAVGSGAIANNGALNLNFDDTFANSLSGTGQLNVNDDVVISRANTGFAGVTVVNDSLVMNNAQAVGSSRVENNGTLSLDFNGTFANALSGNGDLVVDNNVTINRGNMAFSGDTEITSGGSLTLNHFAGIGNSATQAVTNDGSLVFDLSGSGTNYFVQEITGAGTLTKNGAGTVVLDNAANDYTGKTTVNAGMLVTDLAEAMPVTLPCGTDLTVAAGATYQAYSREQWVRELTGAGTVDMQNHDLTVCKGDFSNGAFVNMNNLTKNGTEKLTIGTLNPATSQIVVENLTVGDGILAVNLANQDQTSTTPKIQVNDTATFGANSTFSIGRELTLEADRVIIQTGATLDICACSGEDITVIRSTNPMTQGFSKYTVGGVELTNAISLDVFITGLEVGLETVDYKEIIITAPGELVWNNILEKSAHGTFNVLTDFTLSQKLEDQEDKGQFFKDPSGNTWDGMTLTKTGGGNLTLAGDNTYTGGTVIKQGTITAKNENSLGTGAVDIDTGGKLALDYSGTFTNTLRGGTGSALDIDGNINIVTSNDGFSGDTSIKSGTTTLQRADGLGDSAITLNNGSTLYFNTASSGTSNNEISGTGSLVKGGAGTLTLEKDNLYTGSTTIRGGTLVANLTEADPATLPCGTALTVNANTKFQAKSREQQISVLSGTGTVDMQDFDLTVCSGDFSGGTLENMATLNKNSEQTLAIGGFSGTGLNLNEGTLVINPGETVSLSGTATIASNTTLDIGAGRSLTATDVSIGTTGTTLNVTGYAGSGDVVLIQSANDIGGDFDNYTINGVSVEEQVTSLDVYYYVENILKTDNVIMITGGGLVWNSTSPESAHGTFDITTGTVTIDDDLSDNGTQNAWFTDPSGKTWDGKTLTKTGNGTLLLSGNNDYTGNTVINGGSVVATGKNSLGDPESSGIVEFMNNNASLVLDYTDNGIFSKKVTGGGTIRKIDDNSITVDSDLSNMKGVFQQDAGTVILTPSGNRFGGSYDQRGGTFEGVDGLRIEGDANFEAVVRPNGTLTVDGDVLLNGADYYTDLYLNENYPNGTAHVINGNRIYIENSTLHVNDRGVVADYLQGGSREFVVLHSENGITGDFSDVVGITRLFEEKHGVVGNNYVIELTLREDPFDPYGSNHNTEEVIDTIHDGLDDPDLWPLIDDLLDMDTDDEIAGAVDSLRGTEIVADGLTMALWSPWRSVFNRLNDDGRTKKVVDPCRPADCGRKNVRNAWFEGYYRDENVFGDGNARGYDGRRGGMTVGLDTQLNRRITVGAMFGFGEPKITSRFGKIEADDYTMALYGTVRLSSKWRANAFLGYGRQEFDYRRHDFAGSYRAKYDGDALYTSLELVRPVKWRTWATLLPVFGIDFQKSWTDGFTENGTGYIQSVRKADLGQTSLRVGLNGLFRRGERFDLSTRLQYLRQVGGNTHGTVESDFAMAPNSRVMHLYGVNRGRDVLNAGLGGNLRLGPAKRSSVFVDYDFDCAEHYRAHTGQVGFTTRW